MTTGTRGGTSENEELRALLRMKEGEVQRLVGEIEQLRGELADVSRRLVSADAESGQLLRLHVALTRLVESADRASAVAALEDVVINIVGSEDFAFYERDRASGAFLAAAAMGDTAAAHRELNVEQPLVRDALESGRVRLAPSAGRGTECPVACAPLMSGREITGVVVVFRLLPHKAGLGPRDVEVLELLRAHAATVLHAAELRAAAQIAGTP